MKNTAIKRIITIFLVAGLISTQFVFAASDLTIGEQETPSETYETEAIESEDEGDSESERDSIEKYKIESNSISSEIIADSVEDELRNDLYAEEGAEEDNDSYGRETENPPSRSLPSNYFNNAYDAAYYLDQQLEYYINNNGPSSVTIYIHYGDSEDFEAYQAALFSHLYNAFCGYDNNFFYSIVNNRESEYNTGIRYYKYSYYFNATLTRSEAIEAWNSAQTIANGVNPTLSFDEQVNYVYSEISDNIEYHGVHNAYPTDGCDTAYSLYTGYAVCSGFTGSFCLICYQAGLNAVPLWGTMRGSDYPSQEGHAWNLIENGNTWEQVDCTNYVGLFGTNAYYTYGVYSFFTTDFKSSHMIDTESSGWTSTGAGWTYIDSYGYSLTNQWKADNTGWCYLWGDGCILTNTLLNYDGELYLLKDDGHMAVSEWVYDTVGHMYFNGSGHAARLQWIQYNGYWYYLKDNCYRAENEWKLDSIDWCYLGSDGKMVTSAWAQDSVGWCYLNSSGHITRSQWLLNNNEWYYLKADGHMAASEWAQDSVGWCYMDSSGHITRSQWLLNNNEWYYLKADGHMAASEWAQDSVGWCYMNSSGHITKSAWIQNGGYWYYLKSNGYRAESEWAQDSTGYCWMQSNGRWDSGTKWIGSPRYIGSSYILSGHRVDSQTIAIDGYNCTFNGAGKLISFTLITEPTPEPV